jgi:hypothetical protein
MMARDTIEAEKIYLRAKLKRGGWRKRFDVITTIIALHCI